MDWLCQSSLTLSNRWKEGRVNNSLRQFFTLQREGGKEEGMTRHFSLRELPEQRQDDLKMRAALEERSVLVP